MKNVSRINFTRAVYFNGLIEVKRNRFALKMESKTEVARNLLCVACLSVEKSLRELSTGKTKQYYLNCINEIPVCDMVKTITVCWECDVMLQRVVKFREQVKDSFRILQTYTSQNLLECLLTDISRPPRLKVFNNEPVDIAPNADGNAAKKTWIEHSQTVKHEPKLEVLDRDAGSMKVQSADTDSLLTEGSDVEPESKDEEINKHDQPPEKDNMINSLSSQVIGNLRSERDGTDKPEEMQIVCVKDELKVEYKRDTEDDSDRRDCPTSDCSDLELETKLQEFLNVKKNKKSKESVKSVAKKRKKMKKRCNDKKIKAVKEEKILTVKLTYEEMLSDRERESSKESYLNAVYKCETCIIGFNSSKSHKSHITNKHSPELGKYSCPICSTVISSVESFTEHCKRHFRRYECMICRKRTMDKKAIEQHYFTTHEISLKEYHCNLCGKISKSIDSHRYHRDTHKSRVQCTECEKTFSHRAGLMNHRLAVHELHNTFPCTVCDKVFRWRTSLKRHLEKHDLKTRGAVGGGAGGAFCATCGIEFSSLCSYRRHLRNSLKHVTRDQLKFICDHCNKRFADKTKLRDHIEEKHLHKVYQCHICNKATKNRVGLDQHVRYVHKSRPNNKMCHYCGKGFPTKVQLESHIRTHTGERPFICEFCPTTFSQKSNLYKHNRQVHLNIKTKRYPLCKKRREERKSSEAAVYQPTADSAPKAAEAQKTLQYPEMFNGW